MDRNDNSQRDNDLNKTSPIASGQPPLPPPIGDASPSELAGPVEPRTLGEWFRVNLPTLRNGLLFIVAGIALNELVLHINYAGALLVIVGLGFIIFIHELGHFLVAKWCDVHVTTFSIGFGPALPFCSYTWGDTTYKLAVFPLGGYVQMVGQVDGDEASDGSEDDPRSYKNKTVWQRMAIISAGVIMNAIFACVAFTAVFLIPGKTRQAPIVAAVDSGKPAFKLGIRAGDQIVDVNGIQNPYFEDLRWETMATLGRIEITTLRNGVEKTYDITPHQGPVRQIGISPTVRLQLKPSKALPDFTAPVHTNSAAAKANKPFEFEDVIVGVTDPENPGDSKKMLLPDDPRNPGSGMKDFFEFQRRLASLAGQEITILVERGPEGAKQRVEIKVPPAYHRTLGARMKMGPIVAIRDNSTAQKAGVLTLRPMNPNRTEADDKVQKLEGDVIEKVVVIEPDGKETKYVQGDNLDPVRLPYQLKQWAERLWKARGNNPPSTERKVQLHLKRQSGENAGPVFLKDLVVVDLEWDYDWRDDLVLAMSASSPQAIPELGLAYQIKNQVDGLEPGTTSAQLEPGDEIVDIKFIGLKPDGTPLEGGWTGGKAIKGAEWANMFLIMQTSDIAKVKVKIKRAGKEQELEIAPTEDKSWPTTDERGLIFDADNRIERADNALQAIQMGFRDTHRSIMQVFLSLRGLGAGTIPLDSLGGPLTITTLAYKFAMFDFWEFVFFLGMISVNLAVLNFLPIPVLDGGHMIFLLYEKLRGKPASEGIRVGATYAGLLLLGCLMIFVLFLDIRRLVGG